MVELFSNFSPMMVWLIIGAILILLELLAPGVFLFWLGIAALIVGAILNFAELTVTWQILLFAIFSIITVLIGVKVYKGKDRDIKTSDLNQVRGSSYIGQIHTLTEPIKDGEGRLKLGDTVWRIAGENLPSGSKIRIISVSGNVLNYEAAE